MPVYLTNLAILPCTVLAHVKSPCVVRHCLLLLSIHSPTMAAVGKIQAHLHWVVAISAGHGPSLPSACVCKLARDDTERRASGHGGANTPMLIA